MPLRNLPTDPGERRRLHDAAAARAKTPDQRWDHNTQWLGALAEESAGTRRIASENAEFIIDMKADLMRELGKRAATDDRHEAAITKREAAVGGGLASVLTAVLGLIMYLTGHWK